VKFLAASRWDEMSGFAGQGTIRAGWAR